MIQYELSILKEINRERNVAWKKKGGCNEKKLLGSKRKKLKG